MYCHAGCSNQDILSAVGLKESDLFNNSPKKEKPKVVAEYLYKDEEGNILYKVLRYEPKNFIQAKYVDGKYVYKLDGVRHVLYNLPNVVKSDEIYFVEGEKDANNLNDLGLTTTTTAGGASGFKKYQQDYVNSLKDKTVYIIPDNDKAGYYYANIVSKALVGIARKVKILDLTDEVSDLKQKGDISDVLEKYGKDRTLEILEKLKVTKKEKKSTFPIDSKDELNSDTFSEALKYWNIKLNYDVITKKTNIKGLPEKYAKEEFSKVVPIYIMDNFKKRGIKIPKNTIDLYLDTEFASNNINPVKRMFETNIWDGKDRISEIFDILNIKKDFYQTLVLKWLYQTALLAFNNFNSLINSDGVLVLQGKEGIGKSYFFRLLSMKNEWFGDGLTINTKDKDSIIKATSKWITELGELNSTIGRNQQDLKAFLTSAYDEIRAPYGRDYILRPRTTSFCGTVNPINYLKDPEGNRRFWTIPVTQIDNNRLKEYGYKWVIQLWLEVYNEAKENINCFRLTDEERKVLTKNNLNFTAYLPYEEDLLQLIDTNSNNKRVWRSGELITTYFEKATSETLGKALNKIADNFPERVSISRDSEGMKYYMALKKKDKENVGNVGTL